MPSLVCVSCLENHLLWVIFVASFYMKLVKEYSARLCFALLRVELVCRQSQPSQSLLMWSLMFHVCSCCHTDRSTVRILLTFDLGCWRSSDMRYTLCVASVTCRWLARGWWRLCFQSTSVTEAWMNSSNAAVGCRACGDPPRGWLGVARRNFSLHVKTQLHFFTFPVFITFISPFFSHFLYLSKLQRGCFHVCLLF